MKSEKLANILSHRKNINQTMWFLKLHKALKEVDVEDGEIQETSNVKK